MGQQINILTFQLLICLHCILTVFAGSKYDRIGLNGTRWRRQKERNSESNLRCHGIDNGCCTKNHPCVEGDGDCDHDSQCEGALICGNDNCPWAMGDDCCQKQYRCDGKDNGCCTSENPCGIGDGDCDDDSECSGELFCGQNNCPLSFGLWDDCCRYLCKGIDNGCCTRTNQCAEGDGDCDHDNECQDSLVCGTNNCQGSTFNSDDDCCKKGCFPADAYVRLVGGRQILMEDVKAGDKVLTLNDIGEPIYSEVNMVWSATKQSNVTSDDFVKISTAAGKTIVLTTRHLIPVFLWRDSTEKTFVFGKDVRPYQHYLLSYDEHQDTTNKSLVISLEYVTKRGFYAPLTMEGTVVVNDVYASCYASIPSHYLLHYVVTAGRGLYSYARFFTSYSFKELVMTSGNIIKTMFQL